MNDLIKKIIDGTDIEQIFEYVIKNIYQEGPKEATFMEILCYLAIYQEETFVRYQNQILRYMGLNYKNITSETLPEIVFGMYAKHIEDNYKYSYTPVQASIVDGIEQNKCFSFSAPTSTGKSYVFRNIIMDSCKDIVIVVPSRALINEYYYTMCGWIKDKEVNILTFIDNINTKKAKRNVFIVTPERCKELFKRKHEFEVEYFLFDEAQLSNEENSRGLFFDSIIRRIQKAYPYAKFIFAHPFVKNPDAQIQKNHFDVDTSESRCYEYRNVGQMFYAHNGENFYHFGIDKEIMGNHKQLCRFDPIENTIKKDGSILVYTKKASIYKKHVFADFKKYIDLCPEIKDEEAIKYIKQIKKYIGANDEAGAERYSQMVSMLKRGIVIHHGSLPLQARLLIEQFTQAGFCKICFATSTLEQGINMPFDIVFLNTFEASKPLSLKNLIGRAGRSTRDKKFDFGSIIVKVENMSKLREIIKEEELLDTVSLLEQDVGEDLQEFKEAILEGTLSDEYNITEKQLDKLKTDESEQIIFNILNVMFAEGKIVELSRINQDLECKLELYELFIRLYEQYLGRELVDGEKNVLNTAIKILLWQVHCKTFKDICFYRYSYASRKQEREQLQKKINNGDELESLLGKMQLERLEAAFVTGYADIPDKNLKVFSMFGKHETKAKDVDYDRIVFDTYDYLDKIINFKLSDVFVAAFEEYYQKTYDERARKIALLVKYGTEDEKEIWMLRYGFSFEDIEWIEPYIVSINQEEVLFSEKLVSYQVKE
ncbi:MAG: DEAD/DEAH box helicase [Alphaproteobacteria bacterium]|nr:DEAD/DEAH box helicase [Alphaproteobacteria bacterium]